MSSIYQFEAANAQGQQDTLNQYKGKVLLVVNTASKCGLTPQFEGLEKLYKKYKDQGLVVLGFPCNQFANQDPGSDDDIQAFCQMNYGVSFPMHSKVNVNGNNAHPLFKHLKAEAPGVLGSKNIKWNFTKFLVGRDGNVIDRFAPATTPEKLSKAIVAALKN